MKKFRIIKFVALALPIAMLVMMTIPSTTMAAQPTVGLGTAASFAVLAGSGITNTGPTTINGDAGGDVGSDPTGTFTGEADVTLTGTVHLADAVAAQAKADLVTAYNDAAGRGPVTTIPADLGGQLLYPGVYDTASGAFSITGTLTLDAQGDPDGVFIFKTASTLITASNSDIDLLNGARYCRTFWQVGSSATLGTDSHFVGHIFALTDITANTGASVQGQLLARNGAVTLDTNTITNGFCATIGAPVVPLINVTKVASPSALTAGPGNVTYTYEVTNPGPVELTTITVTDDKVATVNYVSGDDGDSILQTTETWIYTSTAFLTATTTNIVTATGEDAGTTATDTESATVVVAAGVIDVTKSANPVALPNGPGNVTYTYSVTNPGPFDLSSVAVTDDKVATVSYVSGDANADLILQATETWIYTSTALLSTTTTNTATATGTANGITVSDVADATVTVTPKTVAPSGGSTAPSGGITSPTGPTPTEPTPTGPEVPIITEQIFPTTGPTPTPPTTPPTITGGPLPKTDANLFEILFAGFALLLVGCTIWLNRKRYE
jgi:uncharacterized repeat protein (TIGR01451 family)